MKEPARSTSLVSTVLGYAGLVLLVIGLILRIWAPGLATPFMSDHPRSDTLAFIVGLSYALLGIGVVAILAAVILRRRAPARPAPANSSGYAIPPAPSSDSISVGGGFLVVGIVWITVFSPQGIRSTILGILSLAASFGVFAVRLLRASRRGPLTIFFGVVLALLGALAFGISLYGAACSFR